MNDTQTKAPVKAEQQAAAPMSRGESLWQPIVALREEVDRLFDNFWNGFGGRPGRMPRLPAMETSPPWRFGTSLDLPAPAMDLVEAEKEYCVKAELPGMDAKDIELSLSDDMLTIKGEKQEERDEKRENYHLSERRFGSFHRSFQLPRGVDREHIEARFDKGVLTVHLPKTAEAAAMQKKIEVKQG